MIVAASVLGTWSQVLPKQICVNKVYVDDRLLLDFHSNLLQDVFTFTETWDAERGFSTRPKKVAFSTKPECQNLQWRDVTHVNRQMGNIVYLGVPLPFVDMGRQDCSIPLSSSFARLFSKLPVHAFLFSKPLPLHTLRWPRRLHTLPWSPGLLKLSFQAFAMPSSRLVPAVTSPLISRKRCSYTKRISLTRKPPVYTPLFLAGVAPLLFLALPLKVGSISWMNAVKLKIRVPLLF